MRRRRRESMLRAVRWRVQAVKRRRFDSVSSTGEEDWVRGTTVVLISNRGTIGDRGETGGTHGIG